jgi:hypothetical protein
MTNLVKELTRNSPCIHTVSKLSQVKSCPPIPSSCFHHCWPPEHIRWLPYVWLSVVYVLTVRGGRRQGPDNVHVHVRIMAAHPYNCTVKPLAAPRLLASCQYACSSHGNKPHAAPRMHAPLFSVSPDYKHKHETSHCNCMMRKTIARSAKTVCSQTVHGPLLPHRRSTAAIACNTLTTAVASSTLTASALTPWLRRIVPLRLRRLV